MVQMLSLSTVSHTRKCSHMGTARYELIVVSPFLPSHISIVSHPPFVLLTSLQHAARYSVVSPIVDFWGEVKLKVCPYPTLDTSVLIHRLLSTQERPKRYLEPSIIIR